MPSARNAPLDKVRVLQRKLYRAAKTNPKRKFGVLYDKVCRDDVLRRAYTLVRLNRGASGIDDMTFERIEKEIGLDLFLDDVREQLVSKRYKPQPVRRVYIPKADGKQRPLGIPVIADRVVQAAAKIVLEPIFEADFKDFSYGFRPRKNAHQALREIYKWLNFGCHYVIDADIKSYFDTISHDKLLQSVRSRVIDRAVVKLLKMWLKTGVMEDMQVRAAVTGTPQGGVISPLLANLYLNWLDRYWESKGFGKRPHDAHIVRYADDFVILCSQRPEFYLGEARKVVDRLGLALNGEKTRLVNAAKEPFDFLGHRFMRKPSKRTGKVQTYYYPSPKAMTSIRRRIHAVTRRGQHRNLPELIKERVNPLLRGWGHYFATGNSWMHFNRVDNYATCALAIMLRKKHKKPGKGWRDHPPSWFYDLHGLLQLSKLVAAKHPETRYAKQVPS